MNKDLQRFLRKIRRLLWVIGFVCVVLTVWFVIKTNWTMATNFGFIAAFVVGVPELLSEDGKESGEPLPSSEEIAKYQKEHPTPTLAESINELREGKTKTGSGEN